MHVHIHILIHVYAFENITFAFQSYTYYIFNVPNPPPFPLYLLTTTYPPQAYDHPSLEKEVQIMKLVDHPNVMRLFAVYDEPTKAHLGQRPLPRTPYLLPVHPIPLNSTP